MTSYITYASGWAVRWQVRWWLLHDPVLHTEAIKPVRTSVQSSQQSAMAVGTVVHAIRKDVQH